MNKHNTQKRRAHALPAVLLLSLTVGAIVSGSGAAAETNPGSGADSGFRETPTPKEEQDNVAEADTERAASEGDEVTVLEPITVTGEPSDDTSYSVPNATTATKTDTPIFDTPVSIQVVPQQVLRDQQAIRLKDALKNVSGVVNDTLLGGYREFFNIRGFSTERRQYRDGFLNDETTFSLANAERIEVLKGPASVLYGRLEPGGLINIVTKRPLQEPYYSLEQQFGSFDTYRTTADATGPITADESLAYRFNLEYLDQDNFRDFFSTERIFLAPSLTWRPSERTQIDLDFTYQDEDAFQDNGIPAIGNRPAPIPITRNLQEPDAGTTSQTEYYWTALSLSHAITDQWKVRARFQSQVGDGFYGGDVFGVELDEATGILKRGFGLNTFDTDVYFGTVDITGEFSTGGLDHTLLLGADYYNGDYVENGHSTDSPISDINIFNPVYGRVDVQALRSGPPTSLFRLEDEWYGIYLQDQVALGERWHLLAGFRYDWAKALEVCCPALPASLEEGIKTEDSEFSPRVGLLYHPVPWLGLYGSYVEGFNAENAGVDLGGTPLEPQLSEQYEAGLKVELFDTRLSGSLAFFDLTKTNLRTPIRNMPGRFDVTGEARNRGIELDISGALTDYWRLIASYAYIDSEITKDRDTEGGPGNQGNRLRNVPRHAGSFWTQYDFAGLGWPGMTAGAGVFLAGQREGNDANDFQLPGYGRVDALLGYSWRIGPSNITAQVNVENLLDKDYFVSTAFGSRLNILPGAPRTFLGAIRVEF